MTRYEYLKNTTFENVAEFLCQIVDYSTPEDKANMCDSCIASATCKKGHNGFMDWLKEDYK